MYFPPFLPHAPLPTPHPRMVHYMNSVLDPSYSNMLREGHTPNYKLKAVYHLENHT